MRFGNTFSQKQAFGLVLHSPFTIFVRINSQNMIRKLILAFIWGSVWGVNAQQTSTLDFCSPFDFPLLLSANFGSFARIIFITD